MTARERGTLPADLRARLIAARVAAGLTHRQLGDRIGVAFPHVWRIEAGERRPSAVVARLLAVALGLDEPVARALIAASASDAGRSRRARDAEV